jgi:hypothetical protein
MAEIDRSNSLADLAARIRTKHEAVRHAQKSALELAMAAGDMLLEAKSQLNHGQWSPWLQEYCAIPDRTARLYMRLAKNRKVIETVDAVDLSISAAVRLLATPKDDDEAVDDIREQTAAAIKVLVAEQKANAENLKKDLAEVRATFDTEEEFEAWLREQEFPNSETCDAIIKALDTEAEAALDTEAEAAETSGPDDPEWNRKMKSRLDAACEKALRGLRGMLEFEGSKTEGLTDLQVQELARERDEAEDHVKALAEANQPSDCLHNKSFCILIWPSSYCRATLTHALLQMPEMWRVRRRGNGYPPF